jgi:nicotinamide-nucleotide amidase
MLKIEKIVNKLIENKETISTMESCTGGFLASTITNISGSSEIFKFGAVTYSNEFKIKMGVSEQIINKYSVYSMETAHEMSENICEFSNSTYGVGITGKINKEDLMNKRGNDNEVFVSIYNSKLKEHRDLHIICPVYTREKVKKYIVNKLLKELEKEIK